MICYNFDNHPYLSDIKNIISDFDPNLNYILIASPQYSFPSYFIPVQNYIFYSSPDQLPLYVSYTQSNKKIVIESNEIVLQEGFPSVLRIPILTSSSSTTPNNTHIEIIEPDTDIYNPIPHPYICDKITETKDNSELSKTFLYLEFNTPSIRSALESYRSEILLIPFFLPNNLPRTLTQIQNHLEKITSLIFALPYIQVLPIYIKNSLNELIFNALTGPIHNRLLKAYHKKFKKENQIAKISIQNEIIQNTNIIFDSNIIIEITSKMQQLFTKKTTLDLIHVVFSIFQSVIKGINNKNTTVDDIIPALYIIMGKDAVLSSHIYSLFSYLSDIWPSGLNDSISYALITFNAAANHLIQFEKNSTNS